MITYEEWEKEIGISPVSPEAYYTEVTWNKLIDDLIELVKRAHDAEPDKTRMAVLLEDELSFLDTGLRLK